MAPTKSKPLCLALCLFSIFLSESGHIFCMLSTRPELLQKLSELQNPNTSDCRKLGLTDEIIMLQIDHNPERAEGDVQEAYLAMINKYNPEQFCFYKNSEQTKNLRELASSILVECVKAKDNLCNFIKATKHNKPNSDDSSWQANKEWLYQELADDEKKPAWEIYDLSPYCKKSIADFSDIDEVQRFRTLLENLHTQILLLKKQSVQSMLCDTNQECLLYIKEMTRVLNVKKSELTQRLDEQEKRLNDQQREQ